MSKDIWHTADKTPEEDRLIVVKSKRTGEYLVGSEFEFILDNFTKWSYFDDLLALETELKRTRKALRIAVDALKNVFDYAKIVSSELQKNHLSQFQTPINKMQYSAQQALKQINNIDKGE